MDAAAARESCWIVAGIRVMSVLILDTSFLGAYSRVDDFWKSHMVTALVVVWLFAIEDELLVNVFLPAVVKLKAQMIESRLC